MEDNCDVTKSLAEQPKLSCIQLPLELWYVIMECNEPTNLIRGLYCVNKTFHELAKKLFALQLAQFTKEFEARIQEDHEAIKMLYHNRNFKSWNPNNTQYLIQHENRKLYLYVLPTARIRQKINDIAPVLSTWPPYVGNEYTIYCRIPSEEMRISRYIPTQEKTTGFLLTIDTRDLASFWDFLIWLKIATKKAKLSARHPRNIVVIGYYSQNCLSEAGWLTFNLARLMNWTYFLIDVENQLDWERVWPKLIQYYSLEPMAVAPPKVKASHLSILQRRCNLQ